jgi:fructose-1,6-bisphosphatase/inositol monophosphatase family enzyme
VTAGLAAPGGGALAADGALAGRLARHAGSLAARMRAAALDGGEALRIDHKTSITDVVSSADRAAEEWIAAELAEHRPDDGLVGEEGARSTGSGAGDDAGRVWYVDPVDGTFNFVSNMDAWCSAIGLTVDGEPALGAIYQPSRDELWVGGPNLPTTRNGEPIARLADRELSEAGLVTYIHPDRMSDPTRVAPVVAAMRAAATVRMLGSGSVELASVAAGRLGVWMQPSSAPWDWVPGAALVRGAGGSAVVIQVGDRPWHIAGPPTAVAQLADVVRTAALAAAPAE